MLKCQPNCSHSPYCGISLGSYLYCGFWWPSNRHENLVLNTELVSRHNQESYYQSNNHGYCEQSKSFTCIGITQKFWTNRLFTVYRALHFLLSLWDKRDWTWDWTPATIPPRCVKDSKLLRFLLFMADITRCHLFLALTLMQSMGIRINCIKCPSSEFSYVSGHKCPTPAFILKVGWVWSSGWT